LNSDTQGINSDVLNSLISDEPNEPINRLNYESDDRTSFLIGIPTESDNTFQQGQTSNTPIIYDLNITQSATNDYALLPNLVPPVMGLLIDTTFNIKINANGQPPTVSIEDNDITSPEMQT
jgi:hypothetical protein